MHKPVVYICLSKNAATKPPQGNYLITAFAFPRGEGGPLAVERVRVFKQMNCFLQSKGL